MMKPAQTVLVVAMLGTTIALGGQQPPGNDLTGTWSSISNEHNGQPDEATMTLTIGADRAALGFVESGKPQVEHYRIRVDRSVTPATIDFVRDDGKSYPGIFKMEDGALTLCLLTTGSGRRPDRFVTSQGDARQLTTLKREGK